MSRVAAPIEPADIAAGLQRLADAFWRGEPSAGTAQVYFDVLGDLAKSELNEAVDRAVRELDFMPTAGKLLELAGRSRVTGLPEQIPAYHFPIPE